MKFDYFTKPKESILYEYQTHKNIRQLPKNFQSSDQALFYHEIQRIIPQCSVQQLKSVDLLGDALLQKSCGRFLWNLTHQNQPKLDARSIARYIAHYVYRKTTLDKAVWIYDEHCGGYFHWLADSLQRLEACWEFLDKDHFVVLPRPIQKQHFVIASLDLLGVPYVLVNHDRQRVHIKQLITATHGAPSGNFNVLLMQRLRSRFTDRLTGIKGGRLNGSEESANLKIWVSRAKAPRRKIKNEDQLIPILCQHGFQIVCLEDLSFVEQVMLMSKTKVLAGLHGAGLTNMLFMPEGGHVVEIRRQGDSHNNCFFAMASALGHNYFYSLAQSDSVGDVYEIHQTSDYWLSPEQLDNALNILGDTRV